MGDVSVARGVIAVWRWYSNSFFFYSVFPFFLYYYPTGQTWHPDLFPFSFSSCWGAGWFGGRRLFDSLLVLSDGVDDRLFERRDEGVERRDGAGCVLEGQIK